MLAEHPEQGLAWPWFLSCGAQESCGSPITQRDLVYPCNSSPRLVTGSPGSERSAGTDLGSLFMVKNSDPPGLLLFFALSERSKKINLSGLMGFL